jgi:hypothetical protein
MYTDDLGIDSLGDEVERPAERSGLRSVLGTLSLDRENPRD